MVPPRATGLPCILYSVRNPPAKRSSPVVEQTAAERRAGVECAAMKSRATTAHAAAPTESAMSTAMSTAMPATDFDPVAIGSGLVQCRRARIEQRQRFSALAGEGR